MFNLIGSGISLEEVIYLHEVALMMCKNKTNKQQQQLQQQQLFFFKQPKTTTTTTAAATTTKIHGLCLCLSFFLSFLVLGQEALCCTFVPAILNTDHGEKVKWERKQDLTGPIDSNGTKPKQKHNIFILT